MPELGQLKQIHQGDIHISTLSSDAVHPASVKTAAIVYPYQRYSDGYDLIPGEEAQVLPTKGTLLTKDITVHPIPQNYGRIEWNGATLSVI